MGTGVMMLALVAAGFGGAGWARVSAQEGTPGATPAAGLSCTADLGIVRSAKTCVNVVHASPDAPDVDVYLNGTLAIAGLAFGTASGFVAVPAGTYRVQVTAAGAEPESVVIDVAELELVAARAYEIAAVGLLAEIAAMVYDVEVAAIEGAARFGSAQLRVIHAAPETPAIDVSLIADDIATRPVAGLAFPDASAYTVTAAGTYRVRVAPSESGDEVLFLPEVTFERDTIYSVFAIGQVGDGTLMILPVATAASRLPAASPEA